MRPNTNDPGYRNRKERATYPVEYTCRNCGRKITVEIERGTRIPIFTPEIRAIIDTRLAPLCEHCGCNVWSPGVAK